MCKERDFLSWPTVCGHCDYITLHSRNGNKTGVKPKFNINTCLAPNGKKNIGNQLHKMTIWISIVPVTWFKSKMHKHKKTSVETQALCKQLLPQKFIETRRNLFFLLQNSMSTHIINIPHIKWKWKYEGQNYNVHETNDTMTCTVWC